MKISLEKRKAVAELFGYGVEVFGDDVVITRGGVRVLVLRQCDIITNALNRGVRTAMCLDRKRKAFKCLRELYGQPGARSVHEIRFPYLQDERYRSNNTLWSLMARRGAEASLDQTVGELIEGFASIVGPSKLVRRCLYNKLNEIYKCSDPSEAWSLIRLHDDRDVWFKNCKKFSLNRGEVEKLVVNVVELGFADVHLFGYVGAEKPWYKYFRKVFISQDVNAIGGYEYYDLLVDSFKMGQKVIEQLGDGAICNKYKNIKEMHDDITNIYNSLMYEDRELDLANKRLYDLIDGKRFGDMVVKVPRRLHDMLDAGQELRNCVLSYVDYVEKGVCFFVFFLTKGGSYTHAIEARTCEFGQEIIEVRQFVGKYNEGVSNDMVLEMEEWLKGELGHGK